MPFVDRIVFLALDAEPPAALGLRPLATFEATFAAVVRTFTSYLAADAKTAFVNDLDAVAQIQPVTGLTVAYLMGHAWLEDGDYRTAARRGGVVALLTGSELVASLRVSPGDDAVLLFVDTCHAAALRPAFEAWPGAGRVTVFASAADNSTLEFPLDRATRFAPVLDTSLAALRGRTPLDALELVLRMRDAGSRSGVVRPQTIGYTVQGTPPALQGRGRPPRQRRAGSEPSRLFELRWSSSAPRRPCSSSPGRFTFAVMRRSRSRSGTCRGLPARSGSRPTCSGRQRTKASCSPVE